MRGVELEKVVNGGYRIGKAQRIRRKGRDERKIYRIHKWIFENKEILCHGLMPLLFDFPSSSVFFFRSFSIFSPSHFSLVLSGSVAFFFN